ncbi:solute carrier family 22 member 13 [Brachionichthys hirsutus]|uniref:solute carrier family 22 member 13 n=1 Tax=Brachionichthys hirsutus TaxID=412623 RepID=UPI003604B034
MAEFGEILRVIGDFGRFQKLLLLALCVPNAILSFHFASVFFTQSDPDRHCDTDWVLRADPGLAADEQRNLTLPREEDGTFSRCRMFVPVDWDIESIRRFGLNETTGCRDGWVYRNTLYDDTIVTAFDLVCDQSRLLQVAQAVLMAGNLLGCLLFGPFAESFGRKRAAQIPVLLMLVFAATTGLSPNFPLYLVSQFMVGLGYGGYRLNSVILATEWTGVSKRSWGACGTQLFGAAGLSLLAGMIYVVRDWRHAQFTTAAMFAVIAIYIWFIPESARWLMSRGRMEEANQLIRKAAAINKREVPESLLETVAERREDTLGIVALLQSAVLRKYFLTVLLAWFSLNVAYFSLSFNVATFGLDVFLTQLVFGLSEVPAHVICIWLLEVLGRKASVISTLLAGGLACVLVLAVPEGNAVAVTTLVTIGRIFTNWAGSICNVYMQELFPTSFRQTASGLGSIACRAGGLVSPLLNMLAGYHRSVPTLVFSSLTLISGALCFLLPETGRKELPDSIEEAEGNREKIIPIERRERSQPAQSRSTKL